MRDSVLLFLWTNACAGGAAWIAARRLPAGWPSDLRAVGALVVFVAFTHGVLLIAAPLGLAPVTVAAVSTLTLALVSRIAPPVSDPQAIGDDAEPRWVRAATVAAYAVLAGALAAWSRVLLAEGTGFTWDDLAYHAAVPGWWLHTGSLALPPLTYQAYFAHNTEMLDLWFMAPTRSDAHANLVHVVWVALVTTAGLAIGRRLGHGPFLPPLVVATWLLTPKVSGMIGAFTATEIGVASLSAAAIALAWPDAGASRRDLRARVTLCGVAAGLALGGKPTALPMVALLGAWWVWVSPRGARREVALLFSTGVLAFGALWYARNLATTGNPIFPAALGPFPGPFSREAQRQTSLLPSLFAGAGDPSFWREFLYRRFDWPLPMGVGAAVGLVAAPIALLLRAEPRPVATYRALVWCIALCASALFVLQPFSGTPNRPVAPLHHLVSFVTLPYLAAWMLFPSLASGRPRLQAALAVVPLGAVAWALGPGSPDITPIHGGLRPWIALGALIAAATAVGLPRLARPGPRAVVAACCGAFLVLQAVATPWKAARTDENLFERFGGPGGAWRHVATLPAGTRVAELGNLPSSHTLTYPYFGRSFALEPVLVHADGRRRPPLHVAWRDEGPWWWEFGVHWQPVDGAVLVGNLTDAGADVVVVTRWPWKRPWPPHREALRAALAPREPAYADDVSEVWHLRTTSAAGPPGPPGWESLRQGSAQQRNPVE